MNMQEYYPVFKRNEILSRLDNSAGKALTANSDCLCAVPKTHRVERTDLPQEGPVAPIHRVSHKNKRNENVSDEIPTYVA